MFRLLPTFLLMSAMSLSACGIPSSQSSSISTGGGGGGHAGGGGFAVREPTREPREFRVRNVHVAPPSRPQTVMSCNPAVCDPSPF
jgi:hypothetical protein